MNNNNFMKAMSMIDEDLVKEADTPYTGKTEADDTKVSFSEDENSAVVSGVDVYHRNIWKKCLGIAASLVIVLGAVGGGIYHFSKTKDKPVVNEEIENDYASIYETVKENKDSYDMNEYVCNYSSAEISFVREANDYKDKLFEYLDSIEGVKKVEEYPNSFRCVLFTFSDDKSGKKYDFSLRENGYGFWQETNGDENAVMTPPNIERYYYGKDVFEKLFEEALNVADSDTVEAMNKVSQEEIENFVTNHLEKCDGKVVYYPWQSAEECEIKKYSITDKEALTDALMNFEWVKIKESEFEYYDWYDMGIRISENGYLMAVGNDPDPYGCYKLKYEDESEKLAAEIRSVLGYAVDSSDVSSEDIKNALQELTTGTLAQWRSGPDYVPQGRENYETTARYYTLNDGESFINEIASFEWVTCDSLEIDEKAYFYDHGMMNLKGAYNFGITENSFGGTGSFYPLGYIISTAGRFKLKNESDAEKFAAIFDKYLIMEKESEIAEKICSGMTNYDNLRGHFTFEKTYGDEDQIIDGYMSYDAKNEKLYMKGDGHLFYQEKENTIELIMNGHDNAAYRTVEKETGNIDRVGTYRYSSGSSIPLPDNYAYLCKSLEKSLTPRGFNEYNSAKQNNYQITESNGKIELYSHGATDGFYTRIILTERGQLISYENIGPSYKTIFKLDDYEFDSPDFTMEDVGQLYESMKADEEEQYKRQME